MVIASDEIMPSSCTTQELLATGGSHRNGCKGIPQVTRHALYVQVAPKAAPRVEVMRLKMEGGGLFAGRRWVSKAEGRWE